MGTRAEHQNSHSFGGRIAPPRVALVCDFLEEAWPSMDLVGDMLYSHLLAKASDLTPSQVRPSMRMRLSRIPIFRNIPFARTGDRLANRLIDYPNWMRRKKTEFDVFHIIDHSYAHLVHLLPPGRTVVTCHDLDTFRCLLSPALEKRSWQFRKMTRHILNGLLKAGHVACVSNTIRDQLISLNLLCPERVTVVSNGVDKCFNPNADRLSDAKAARLLLDEGVPYLLSVGSSVPRKRLDTVLRVFAAVRKIVPCRLVRVGGAFTATQEMLIDSLGVRDGITVLPFVDRQTLASIYRSAALLLLTSESEGFGLPVVEAMSCGCQVVASDIPVLREIGGPATEFCPVGDLRTWTQTVTDRLWDQINISHESLQRRSSGLAWASKFTWDRTADSCLSIYGKILESQPVH